MKKFTFKVKDSFFPQTFEGELFASNKEVAEQEIKEIYSMQLDTTEDEITIIDLKEVE
jgi:hypothetical protein